MGENSEALQGKDAGFKKFAAIQVLLWLTVVIGMLVGAAFVLRYFEGTATQDSASTQSAQHEIGAIKTTPQKAIAELKDSLAAAGHGESAAKADVPKTAQTAPKNAPQPVHSATPATTQTAKREAGHATTQKTTAAHTEQPQKTTAVKKETTHVEAAHGAQETFPVVGMAFVNAVIKPLDYELNQRFYGWRPNDIANITDNVNNFQLGVLEVTRRSAVILAERISRTGSTAAFDPNLENAMNWFMIKADRYWFPAAETKYRAGLHEMRTYFNNLRDGKAAFYTRTDNLIPLLAAYEDLLGSCDENLVKTKEKDGSTVSTFMADNYFFYTKGVASAMLTILEAIQQDFNIMVTREGGMEVLHHAIESCRLAVEIDPWIILNSSPDSIFANHRSNMAAPISHARFYVGVLIKALST